MDETLTIDPRPAMRAKAEAAGWDPELLNRFMSKTEYDPATGCLNWTDAPTADGYGTMSWKGRNVYAHRLGFEIANGPVPEGLSVLHSCKKNRRCVNHDHLRAGSPKENMADAVKDGTAGRPPGRVLSDEDIATVEGFELLGVGPTETRRRTGISSPTIQSVKLKNKPGGRTYRPDAAWNELDRLEKEAQQKKDNDTPLDDSRPT